MSIAARTSHKTFEGVRTGGTSPKAIKRCNDETAKAITLAFLVPVTDKKKG